ncbi:hypothetical protein N5D66_27920 [Delftia tsuruhatensis]|uniref:hypothetical protein n=1 Tax=Delftia tsuruhatensis TaxID=180282 RepID=UPI002446DAD7|nr:hypothetical protein [Delftia tsuruhatensis]MDH0851792.1 hypothetical protein [Delftia tsuruhatensis]
MNYESDVQVGRIFSSNYLRPTEPVSDSPRFRIRLGNYLAEEFSSNHSELTKYIGKNLGVKILIQGAYGFTGWFEKAKIRDILDVITIVWRFFNDKGVPIPGWREAGNTMERKRNAWQAFVTALFREESLAYRVDEKGGVHYLVDAEFEIVRIASISGLGEARYRNVHDALDKAYAFLDEKSIDTKSSARSAFEALEILAKLIYPEAQSLGKKMVIEKLKPLVLQDSEDVPHEKMAGAILDSLAEFVNGVHYYRHGQPEENIVAPPFGVAVYILSQVSNAIRFLIPVDKRIQSGRNN